MIRFVSYLIVCAFTSLAVSAAYAEDSPVAFADKAGNALTLRDFKGKPVVLNLWASWCAPCVAEMPLLAAVQQQYATQGLTVIALSEDDSVNDATAFYKSSGITGLAPYYDSGRHAWRTLHVEGIPTSFFIDKNGDVVRSFEGYVDWQSPEIQRDLRELVSR